MKEFVINDLIKNIKDTYIKYPKRIIEDANLEFEKIDDYNGRQLLEMIQNADDEAVIKGRKNCLIELKDDILVIANNGNIFSKEGLESLFYSHSSPKFNKENKIGKKGTGFRSILSWANSVYIKSGSLSVEFSKGSSLYFLQELLKESKYSEKKIKDLPGYRKEHPISILRTPKWIDEILYNEYSIFDTYIVIKLKTNSYLDIEDQIKNIKSEIMLFLQNLEEIEIKSAIKNEIISVKKSKNKATTKVFDTKLNVLISEKDWFIKSKKGTFEINIDDEIESKTFELKIALPNGFDIDKNNNTLFSYFKTNVKFPFSFLAHGTFELTGNRDNLIVSESNKKISYELAKFIIETISDLSHKEKDISWKFFEDLLVESYNLDINLSKLGFFDKFISLLKESYVLPTVSNKYISLKENPVLYNGDYRSILSIDVFDNILIQPNERIKKFLQENGLLNNNYYDIYFFVDFINKNTSKLSINQRVEFFYFLESEFYSNKEKNIIISKETFPNLFIDSNNNIVESLSDIFISPSDSFNIPKSISFRFLNSFLYNEISLSYNLNEFGIKNSNIETIVSELKNNISKNNDFESYKDLLQFLLAVKKSGQNFSSDISIDLINKKNYYKISKELFFTSEYGNEFDILEKLLNPIINSENIFIESPSRFNFLELNINELKEFFIWLGVKKKINIIEKELSNDNKDFHSYKNFVYENLSYPFVLKSDSYYKKDFLSPQELSNETRDAQIKIFTLEYIDEILEKTPFEVILSFIMNNSEIYNLIASGYEKEKKNKYGGTEYSFVIETTGSRKETKRFLENKDVKSYLGWKLLTCNWIKLKKNNTFITISPEKCCLHISKDFSPFIESLGSILTEDFIKNNLGDKLNKQFLENFFLKIGVKEDLSSISMDYIYKILIQLPYSDIDAKYTKSIYRQILEYKTFDKDMEKYLDKSLEFKKFKDKGLIFSKLNNDYSYKHISDVFYISDLHIPSDIEKNFRVINVEKNYPRKIEKFFGVKSINIKYNIDGEVNYHNLNVEFKKDLNAFKSYMYSYLYERDKDEKTFRKIVELKINICSSLKAKYIYEGKETSFDLKNFEYIEFKNQYFILVPESIYSLRYLKEEIDFYYSIINIISKIEEKEDFISLLKETYTKDDDKRNILILKNLGLDFKSKLDDIKTKFNSIGKQDIEYNNDEIIVNKKDENIVQTKDKFSILNKKDSDNQSILDLDKNKKDEYPLNEVKNHSSWSANYPINEINIKDRSINFIEDKMINLSNLSDINNPNVIIENNYSSDNLSKEDKKNIGYYGEQCVIEHLKNTFTHKYPEFSIKENENGFEVLNEQKSIANVIWFNKNKDTGKGFDIKIEENNELSYIEVKSTKNDNKEWFELSTTQWAVAKQEGERFFIYRVYNVGNKDVSISIIHNPYKLLLENKIKVNSIKIHL